MTHASGFLNLDAKRMVLGELRPWELGTMYCTGICTIESRPREKQDFAIGLGNHEVLAYAEKLGSRLFYKLRFGVFAPFSRFLSKYL